MIKTVSGWNDGMGQLDLVDNQQVASSLQPPLRCCKGLAAPTTCSAANTFRPHLWSHLLPPTSRSRSHPSSHRQAKVTPFPRQAGHLCLLFQVPEHPALLVGTRLACISAGFRPLFPILPLPPPLHGCWLKYHSLINIRNSKLWLNLLPGEPKLLYSVKSLWWVRQWDVLSDWGLLNDEEEVGRGLVEKHGQTAEKGSASGLRKWPEGSHSVWL